MKYMYDTEFLEIGGDYPIAFISIGVVAEDGREYYAVNKDMPMDLIQDHEWLMANVVPKLPPKDTWKPRHQIAEELLEFFAMGEGWPQLLAWFSAYDHVVLAQIFGRMIDMPKELPMYTHDLRSMCDWLGINPNILPKQKGGNHDALEDARHLKVMFDFMMEIVRQREEQKVAVE